MRTAYAVEPADSGAEVTATTEFAVGVALVGGLIDATVIGRQCRRELETQFDWLADAAAGERDPPGVPRDQSSRRAERLRERVPGGGTRLAGRYWWLPRVHV